MRVRRFLFAVQQKDHARGHARALGHKAVRSMHAMEANIGSSLPTDQQRGHAWHRRDAAWRLGRAWWGLVGLGYFATLSGLIGLAGKYFALVFSGLRGRMPEVGALAKKLRHGCVLGSTAAKHDWAGHVCAIQIRPMAKVSGKRHILSFPVPGAKSMPQIGICCWRAKSRRRRPREQHVGLQKRLRRNDHKKGGTRRFPL